MNDDTAKRLGLAYINLRLMYTDAEAAMQKLADQGQPVEFQAGLVLGLTGAKHVLDGKTADEAWDLLKPIVEAIRKKADA